MFVWPQRCCLTPDDFGGGKEAVYCCLPVTSRLKVSVKSPSLFFAGGYLYIPYKLGYHKIEVIEVQTGRVNVLPSRTGRVPDDNHAVVVRGPELPPMN